MANYTCVMLYISGFENEAERIKEVNSFLNNGQVFSLIDVNDTQQYPDAFPRFLYVGTYKNFNTPDFLSFLISNVKWDYPEYVQVFIQEEEDYTIKVYTNAGRVLAVDSLKETDE
jgi:hypothetical protein